MDLIALDLILGSNSPIWDLLVIWQIWVECVFELLLNFIKLLLHGKNWLEELNKVEEDLLGSQLGQQETKELIIVLIVPWVEGDIHQGKVVVQSIKQEKPVDEGILITLLVPVVLFLSGDGSHCLVDLTANDDEHTVGNGIDLAFDLVHLCWLLNDIATSISLALGIKDYMLIEAHCCQNDRKGDVGDQLEQELPMRGSLDFLDLDLFSFIIEHVEILELIFPFVDWRERIILATPEVLDHSLLSLPALHKKSSPYCDHEAVDSIERRVKSLLPLVSSTVNVQLIEEKQDTASTRDKQPSLVMEEECIFKRVFFTVVVFNHIYWLEWLRVVSAKPHKAFEELPLVLVETLGHRMD